MPSIVIPTLNEENYLPLLLESLKGFNEEVKIGEELDYIRMAKNLANSEF